MVLCLHAWPAGQYGLKSPVPRTQIPLFQLFRELKKAYMEMEDKKIQFFLQEQGPDWIRWHNSPLLASHMAEVWERQIRSARFILESLLETH